MTSCEGKHVHQRTLLWFKVGRRKSADYLCSTFWFSNPMNSRMKSVKHSKFQQIFFQKKKCRCINLRKQNYLRFLTVHMQGVWKFPFYGLEKQQPEIHNHFRLGVSWNMIHLRNLQIRYLNCKFEVKLKMVFILHNVLHLSAGELLKGLKIGQA